MEDQHLRILLADVMREQLQPIEKRLERMEGTDNAIQAEVRLLGGRVGGVETRFASAEKRLTDLEDAQSKAKRATLDGDEAQGAALVSGLRIHGDALSAFRQESTDHFVGLERKQKADIEAQNAEIALVKKELQVTKLTVEANAAETSLQTAMLRRVAGWSSHPLFKAVFYISMLVAALVSAWTALHGH